MERGQEPMLQWGCSIRHGENRSQSGIGKPGRGRSVVPPNDKNAGSFYREVDQPYSNRYPMRAMCLTGENMHGVSSIRQVDACGRQLDRAEINKTLSHGETGYCSEMHATGGRLAFNT